MNGRQEPLLSGFESAVLIPGCSGLQWFLCLSAGSGGQAQARQWMWRSDGWQPAVAWMLAPEAAKLMGILRGALDLPAAL